MEVFRMGVVDWVGVVAVLAVLLSVCALGFLFLRRLWDYLGRR